MSSTTAALAFDVRVVGEAADLETLRNIVVRNTGFSPVRLNDVALVEDGFQDVTSLRALERRDRAGDGHPQAARLERRRRGERGARARSPTCRRRCPPG